MSGRRRGQAGKGYILAQGMSRQVTQKQRKERWEFYFWRRRREDEGVGGVRRRTRRVGVRVEGSGEVQRLVGRRRLRKETPHTDTQKVRVIRRKDNGIRSQAESGQSGSGGGMQEDETTRTRNHKCPKNSRVMAVVG